MARRKPHSLSQYLKASKELQGLVPSLIKYRRRERLNRWEKAAITRAVNNVNKASMGGTLVKITKTQKRALRGKDILIGKGIRAVRLRNFDPTRDKINIVNGEITTRRAGARRKWHLKRIRFNDLNETIERIERFITKKTAQNSRPVDFQVWSGAGRISIGSEGFAAIPIIIGFVLHYSDLNEDFEDWFFGVGWSVEQ